MIQRILRYLDHCILPFLYLLDGLLLILSIIFLIFAIGCQSNNWNACYAFSNDQGFIIATIVTFILWIVGPIVEVSMLALMYRVCCRRVCSHQSNNQSRIHQHKENSPIVYNDNHNITLGGLERLHPFDTTKYRRVLRMLKQEGVISDYSKTDALSFRDTLHLHSVKYIISLFYACRLVPLLEVPICLVPAALLGWRIILPMARATEATAYACELALKTGWSINLGGGYHHASNKKGHGFCVFADITHGIKHIRRLRGENTRVMIIDLDAHQGNGHERDAIGDDSIYILDAYEPTIFPGDQFASTRINQSIFYIREDTGSRFLRDLTQALPIAVQKFKPDFILYNAGTDTLTGDPLTGLNQSSTSIVARDALVFAACRPPKTSLIMHSCISYETLQDVHMRCAGCYPESTHIPIAMLLSGGYQKSNARVIADSIRNLYQIFGLSTDIQPS